MQTREIPQDQWASFLGDLGKPEHWDALGPVTIEAIGEDAGDQVVARALPLVGLTFETKGSGAGRIEIMVGDTDSNISHTIESPSRMFVKEGDDGQAQALQIKATEEPTTLVTFRAGADPSVITGTEALQGAPE